MIGYISTDMYTVLLQEIKIKKKQIIKIRYFL